MMDDSNLRGTGGEGLGRDPEEDNEMVGLQRSERRPQRRSLQTLTPRVLTAVYLIHLACQRPAAPRQFLAICTNIY